MLITVHCHHHLTYQAIYTHFAAALPSQYDFTTAFHALCHRFVEFAIDGKTMMANKKPGLVAGLKE